MEKVFAASVISSAVILSRTKSARLIRANCTRRDWTAYAIMTGPCSQSSIASAQCPIGMLYGTVLPAFRSTSFLAISPSHVRGRFGWRTSFTVFTACLFSAIRDKLHLRSLGRVDHMTPCAISGAVHKKGQLEGGEWLSPEKENPQETPYRAKRCLLIIALSCARIIPTKRMVAQREIRIIMVSIVLPPIILFSVVIYSVSFTRADVNKKAKVITKKFSQ